MKKLVLSAFVESGNIRLFLDGRQLMTSFPLEMDMEEDKCVLQWFVESPKGGQFTLSISSPQAAEMQLTKRLAKGEKDWGGVEV